MKKLLCALLVLLLVGSVSAAMAECCIYNSTEYPCQPGWQIDGPNRMHRRICFTHVEDKEDAFSHMPITEWESCTLDEGGMCIECGTDYEEDIVVDPDELPDEELAIWMLEMYFLYLEENGIPPVEVSASGSNLTVQLTSGYFEYLDAMGIPYSETMAAKTTYTLSLPQGLTYPYNGQAVTPEVDMDASGYGPGAWLKEMGLMVFEVAYRNNKVPGTATALVEVYLEGGDSYTLQQNFTITGEGSGEGGEDDTLYCKYGSASSPCDIRWDANGELKQHRAYCVAHVEDKEDMYSYVQVTDWEDCTFNANEYICDTCGADYTPDDEPDDAYYEAIMVDLYFRLIERNGVAPVEISVVDNYMMVSLSEQLIMYMLEYGVPVTEELKASTIYTLTLRNTSEYPSTGEAVEPEAGVDVSSGGPGAWMEKYSLLRVGDISYENNVNPGTATAKADISVESHGTYTLAADFTIVGAAGERCECYTPDSPCNVIWWVDASKRQHCRACKNHVEKEDVFSYIKVTDWEDCTLDEGGVCTVCGNDYDKSDNEMTEEDIRAHMVENYCRTAAEFGEAIDATVSGNELTFSMRDEFFAYLEESNVPVSETMMVETTYTLVLIDGDEFAATGEPITPAVEVRASEYGPGSWLQNNGLMRIGQPVYANNVEPGTATVSVTFEFTMGEPYTITASFTILDEGRYCKYGSASSPCDFYWDADGQTRKHRLICVNHVEDKDNPYSYVVVTDWEDCTLDENDSCTICGANYASPEVPDDGDYEAEMLELYNALMEKLGRAPLYVEHSRDSMTIQFSEQFIMYLLEHGIELSESLSATTEYVFTLKDGTSFAYTGEEICPEVIMTGNGVGPGAWLEKNELIFIRKVTYTDNVEPGQATVDVLFRLAGDGNLAFTLNFTITGEGGETPKVPGDADGDDTVSLEDALDLLRAIAGEDVSINAVNADVNGDGKADIHDVLLILQYVAGWNVSLK